MSEDSYDSDEVTRLTALRFLDLVSIGGGADKGDLPPGWAGKIANELTEIGALTLIIDDDAVPPVTRLDLGPMFTSFSLLLEMMIGLIAEEQDVDRLAVISTLRQVVNATYDQPDA